MATPSSGSYVAMRWDVRRRADRGRTEDKGRGKKGRGRKQGVLMNQQPAQFPA